MTSYTVRLQAREEIAERTMALHFSKPADLTFEPGQAVDLVLVDPPDPENARHAFSIVSAPFEEGLVVATRMRDSAFKRALRSLGVGATVELEGPFGSLTLHDDRRRPAVFIAGGIGITPFMSILRQAANDRLTQPIVLLYSNRRPEDAAFLAELQALARQSEHFRLAATMTQMSASSRPWDGATGVVDDGFITRAVGSAPSPIYYVAGPPGMVEAMRQTLDLMGVPAADIRSEEFYGY